MPRRKIGTEKKRAGADDDRTGAQQPSLRRQKTEGEKDRRIGERDQRQRTEHARVTGMTGAGRGGGAGGAENPGEEDRETIEPVGVIRHGATSRRSDAVESGAVMSHAVASGLADTLLQDLWAGRETVSLALTGKFLTLEPSDICAVEASGGTRTVLINRIEDGAVRRIEARAIEPDILAPVPAAARSSPPVTTSQAAAPEVLLMDLPLLTGSEPGFAPRIAAFVRPWPGALAVLLGTAESGFTARQTLDRRATMGELTAPLGSGPLGRWDRGNAIEVTLYGGALAGEPRLGVLNGANVAAIGTPETGYEIVQFQNATMTGATNWRLETLLRGQAGTDDIGAGGHVAGARFVLLDGAVQSLAIGETESGLALTASLM
jgi:Putative phage tail protein